MKTFKMDSWIITIKWSDTCTQEIDQLENYYAANLAFKFHVTQHPNQVVELWSPRTLKNKSEGDGSCGN